MSARHITWLEQLTDRLSVAGREERAVAWVEAWVARRSDLRLRKDPSGNLLITFRRRRGRPHTWLTAHLDHPGFLIGPETASNAHRFEFRGGVLDPYFEDAPVEIHTPRGVRSARVEELVVEGRRRTGTLRLRGGGPKPEPGDLGRWRFRARDLGVRGDRLRAHAIDDLAGVAAVLSAFDDLRHSTPDVGLLLTRAEEVGFVGAIAACEAQVLPADAEIICVEMSRSFVDSPIGGGPIVRVGDASSSFDADLTNRATATARALARRSSFAWQRKLMVGGSCEATAFGAFGYAATCLCLPLGNYHNMADIAAVQEGERPARVAPETISLADFTGLVALLRRLASDPAEPSLDLRLTEAERRLLAQSGSRQVTPSA